MNLIITKAGFRDERISFDLSVLPSATQIYQLPFGRVTLAHR
jgi:hypothetical protein